MHREVMDTPREGGVGSQSYLPSTDWQTRATGPARMPPSSAAMSSQYSQVHPHCAYTDQRSVHDWRHSEQSLAQSGRHKLLTEPCSSGTESDTAEQRRKRSNRVFHTLPSQTPQEPSMQFQSATNLDHEVQPSNIVKGFPHSVTSQHPTQLFQGSAQFLDNTYSAPIDYSSRPRPEPEKCPSHSEEDIDHERATPDESIPDESRVSGSHADSVSQVGTGSAVYTQEHPRQHQRTANLSVPLPPADLMQEHESYHEEISGAEAKQRLKFCHAYGDDTCYLTRHSKKENKYILTVYRKIANDDNTEKVKHFHIKFESGKYQLENLLEHKDLPAMLKYYEKYRVDAAFKSIGRCVTEKEYIQRKQEQDRHQQRQLQEPNIQAEPRPVPQPRPDQEGINQQAEQQPQNALQGNNDPRPQNAQQRPIEPQNPQQRPIEPQNPQQRPIEPQNPQQRPIEPQNAQQRPIEPQNAQERPIEPQNAQQRPIEAQNAQQGIHQQADHEQQPQNAQQGNNAQHPAPARESWKDHIVCIIL